MISRKGAKAQRSIWVVVRLCAFAGEKLLLMQTVTEAATAWTDTDRRMMARALELAKKGVGQVSPGPLVGCVVVNPAGEIVGEGFYLFEAIKHAETIALNLAGERARGGT